MKNKLGQTYTDIVPKAKAEWLQKKSEEAREEKRKKLRQAQEASHAAET